MRYSPFLFLILNALYLLDDNRSRLTIVIHKIILCLLLCTHHISYEMLGRSC